MPQYFFDTLENGEHVEDDRGLLCASDADARLQAMKGLSSIAKDFVPRNGDCQTYTVQVRDEANRVVYSAKLTFAGLWLNGCGDPSAS